MVVYHSEKDSMKYAGVAALMLLLVSICSTILVVISLATNLFLPTAIPESDRLNTLEIIVGTLTCMTVPATLALLSFLLFWFGVRQPQRAASNARGTGEPHSPISADVEQRTQTRPFPPTRTAQPPSGHQPTQPGMVIAAPPPLLPGTAAFHTYLDEITELLMSTEADSPATLARRRSVVQERTRDRLRQLDAANRGRVLQVLHNAGWLCGPQHIQLHDIDLSGIDLRFADLRQAQLVGVSLQGASLVGARLDGANLSSANLTNVDLRLACLDQALLYQANLKRAKLHRASLRRVVLLGTQLDETNLWQADLLEAQVRPEQLYAVTSLAGARMPDGTRHA